MACAIHAHELLDVLLNGIAIDAELLQGCKPLLGLERVGLHVAHEAKDLLEGFGLTNELHPLILRFYSPCIRDLEPLKRLPLGLDLVLNESELVTVQLRT